jgi:hypothetical protein
MEMYWDHHTPRQRTCTSLGAGKLDLGMHPCLSFCSVLFLVAVQPPVGGAHFFPSCRQTHPIASPHSASPRAATYLCERRLIPKALQYSPLLLTPIFNAQEIYVIGHTAAWLGIAACVAGDPFDPPTCFALNNIYARQRFVLLAPRCCLFTRIA